MSGDTSCSDEELDLHFQEWISRSKQLKIVVTGQVGSGKSALINSLIGTADKIPGGQVAKEGDSAVSVTNKVGIYTLNKNGVDIVLYDTPGFLDPNQTKLGSPTFAEIHAETGGEIDLLLICKRMGSRLDSGDIRVMQQITKYMGESVWKNAAYVLTFANEVKPPKYRGITQPPTEVEYFDMKWKQMKDTLHEYLPKEGCVTADIAKEIPVVPAGYDKSSLPGRSNWFDDLWLTLCLQIKAASQPAFLKVVAPDVLDNPMQKDHPTTPLDQQKIYAKFKAGIKGAYLSLHKSLLRPDQGFNLQFPPIGLPMLAYPQGVITTGLENSEDKV